jgi:hypothetical protein
MFLCYLIPLDIKSILSEISTPALLNIFGRIIQLDSADTPFSTSRRNITRRPVPTYNNEYNPYEIPLADQDPLYSFYTTSWPL